MIPILTAYAEQPTPGFNTKIPEYIMTPDKVETRIGTLEFATKLAGAKLIVVMGHTECGVVKGACDGAQLGLLTATLANINPAVAAVKGDHTPGVQKPQNSSRPLRR